MERALRLSTILRMGNKGIGPHRGKAATKLGDIVADDTTQQQGIPIIGITNFDRVNAPCIDAFNIEKSVRWRFEHQG